MTLEQKIDKIYEMLREQHRPKKTWVKVSTIKKVTGWDRRDLQKMRDQKIIEYREMNGKYEYCLESVPDRLLKKV